VLKHCRGHSTAY